MPPPRSRPPKQAQKASKVKKAAVVEDAKPSEALPSPLGSVFVGTYTFSVYAATAAPTIVGGDAGELVAEACHLGTAHPPGYPLFTLVVHAVTKLMPDPLLGGIGATPAARANLLCCLCGAIAAALLAHDVVLCIGYLPHFGRRSLVPKGESVNTVAAWAAALAAAGLFAFSPLVWQYAVTAEVFALNNMLCALIVHLTVRYARTRQLSDACWGAFVVGLALCNQHTAVLFGLPIALWVLFTLAKSHLAAGFARAAGALFSLGISGLLGLTPYVYMPIAASVSPKQGSWGHVTTVLGFFHHLRRGDYGSFQLYSGAALDTAGLSGRLLVWAKDLTLEQGLYVLPPLALIGAGLLMVTSVARLVEGAKGEGEGADGGEGGKAKKESKAPPLAQTETLGLLLIITLIFYLVVFHALANLPLDNPLLFGVHARFWQQPLLLVALAGGVGMHSLLTPLGAEWAGIIGLVCALLLVATQASFAAELADQSANTYFDAYADAVASPLPPKSLLLINYDQQWTSIRYQQVCEGKYPGVTILNLSLMTYKWWEHKRALYKNVKFPGTHYVPENSVAWRDGGFTFREFMDSNTKRFPGGIYIGGKLNYPNEKWGEAYETVPFGIVARIEPIQPMPDMPKPTDRTPPEELAKMQEEAQKIMAGRKAKDMQSFSKWAEDSAVAWQTILEVMPEAPPLEKYDMKTWEWTVGREFYDHAAERGAYLLEKGIELFNTPETAPAKMQAAVEAATWFEVCEAQDPDYATHNLKNLGLAMVHIVKTQGQAPPNGPHTITLLEWAANHTREQGRDPVKGPAAVSQWKDYAAERFKSAWGDFLAKPNAKTDPSYESIKGIYESVMQSVKAGVAAQGQAATSGTEGTKKKKKRKKKNAAE
mmetsp:Transcript_72656/g.206890  ORF Transcript_72656/g.206890 Transcript_72656/m.206890 type:complete len:880 (-) Transcript_72656:73-2712(-)